MPAAGSVIVAVPFGAAKSQNVRLGHRALHLVHGPESTDQAARRGYLEAEAHPPCIPSDHQGAPTSRIEITIPIVHENNR